MKRNLIPVALLSVMLFSSGAYAAQRPSATANPSFPVRVNSADGTVRIAHRPTRILSLSASATEMLYAVGAGRQVVGVDKYSTYPTDAPRTKFTGYESSAEDYLPLHPDLVLLAFNTGTLIAQLHKLHISTLLLPPANTIAGVNKQISEIGLATGHVAQAVQTKASLAGDLASAAKVAKGRARGATYYIEIDPTYYTATSHTFIGALFSRFNMVNVADSAGRSGSGYPQISSEDLLKTNPDYVFLADTVCCGQNVKSFSLRPGFGALRAVRLGHVITVNDSVASEWGPHSLETFAGAIKQEILSTTTKATSSAQTSS
ncbi:MAG TPA: ABC transporter substrate-binding protein [Acidimicrobiales bacterium]|nr:ABC transporter substrate-binding protein [Acidimicrobiales bacterium]